MDTSDQWNKTLQQQGPNFKKGYYIYNGHFIPQYDYVYDGSVSTRSSSSSSSSSRSATALAVSAVAVAQPVVDHVLHFENLPTEFATLLSEYGLNDKIQIPLKELMKDENKPKTTPLLTVDNLTEANRRLIEAIYARDFAAFGYQVLAPRPDVAANEATAAAALLRRRSRSDAYYTSSLRPGLEFVHIPKTGGTAVENAAKKQNIRWGANHYKIRPKEHRRYMDVPYWHMPPHYYQRLHTEVLQEFDPYGPNPYYNVNNNATPALFTIVRNPYARVVSEYLFYHREAKHYTNVSKYNDAPKMNAWISSILSSMAHVLQSPPTPMNNNNKSSLSSKNKYTIDTAGHWNKTDVWTNKAFIKYYFYGLGHFIPQYDYVYDTNLPIVVSERNNNDGGNNDGMEGHLPPPPKPVIQHVLHFENLHDEFAALMAQYNLSHVVLSNPHNNNNNNNKTQQQQSSDSSTRKPISLVGVANLTDSTKRLIEKVYARDFAAFGYEMI
jgi:Sulfotransferase family